MRLCKAHSRLLERLFGCRIVCPTQTWHTSSHLSSEKVSAGHSRPCRPCGRSFFITTPIFYVNAAPHIGHLYSCLIADAAARWYRLKGETVIFSTGTDEHGLKIQQAAAKQNQAPNAFSSQVSVKFKEMFDSYNISYTDFIRTTEERHRHTVQELWKTLVSRGHIYKGTYSGWYSVSDEAFLGADDVKEITKPDGQTIKVSSESEQPVTWMEEENYMFRLSNFQQELHKWLDTGAIFPNMFETVVRNWVDFLRDLSISRHKDRLSWGIPVPGDEQHTIYVWLDALANYLTVSGYPDQNHVWPPNYHVVGKDILKFHAVYWPAFLMAAGLEPPKKIFCHSHWMVDGVKMSKSRGNVVDPMIMKEKYSAEAFRYLLLREGVPHNDGNYSETVCLEYINADIVNTCGNLLSRCTAPKLNPEQLFPRKCLVTYQKKFNATERQTFEDLPMLVSTVGEHYENLYFYQGLNSIMSYLRWANLLIQSHEPWALVKSQDPEDILHRKTVIHMALETLRVGGILLQPVIPKLAETLLDRLGIPEDKRMVEHARTSYLNSPECLPLGPNKGPLLERIVVKDKMKVVKGVQR